MQTFPLSNADKRAAVETLLQDAEWSGKSNVWIAERCAVDEGTVRRYRAELTSELPKSIERAGRDGRTINTANIGTKQSTPAAFTPKAKVYIL